MAHQSEHQITDNSPDFLKVLSPVSRIFSYIVYHGPSSFHKISLGFPEIGSSTLRGFLIKLVQSSYLQIDGSNFRVHPLLPFFPAPHYSNSAFPFVLDNATRHLLNFSTPEILQFQSMPIRVLIFAPSGFGKTTALPLFPEFVDSDQQGPYKFSDDYRLTLKSRHVLFFFPSIDVFVSRALLRIPDGGSRTSRSFLKQQYKKLKHFAKRIPSGRFIIPNMLLTDQLFISDFASYIKHILKTFEFEDQFDYVNDSNGYFDMLFKDTSTVD